MTASPRFKSNGMSVPSATASVVLGEVAPSVIAGRREIRDAIRELAVGGVADFPVKNVTDAGGKTSIFVERIA